VFLPTGRQVTRPWHNAKLPAGVHTVPLEIPGTSAQALTVWVVVDGQEWRGLVYGKGAVR
jgi:hypothetical protein